MNRVLKSWTSSYLMFSMIWFVLKSGWLNFQGIYLLTDRWILALIKYHWMSVVLVNTKEIELGIYFKLGVIFLRYLSSLRVVTSGIFMWGNILISFVADFCLLSKEHKIILIIYFFFIFSFLIMWFS